MASKRAAPGGHHLAFSIGKALWDDLTQAALPMKVAEGEFDMRKLVGTGVRQLQVKQRVVALLEDKKAPALASRARRRAGTMWRERKPQVVALIDDILRIEGDWKLEIDDQGTEFHYGDQKIGVDAHVKAVANGRAYLLRRNVEIPFTIEKRLGAECHLGNIRYDSSSRAVVGDMMKPRVDFGENVILRLLNRAGALLLDEQLSGRFRSVPILKKEQLEGLFAPAGGALKLQLGIDDVQIEVSEDDMTLRVRFGFSQLQLTDAAGAR